MPPRSRAVPRQRVLVVNDDGIDAPGLRAWLRRGPLGDDAARNDVHGVTMQHRLFPNLWIFWIFGVG